MKSRTGRWWIENLLRPALVAGMLVCLLTPLTRVLEVIFEGWDATVFLVFAFFAALEGILSQRVLKEQGIKDWGYLISRSAEMVVLLILLKLISYVPYRLDQLWVDVLRWQTDPVLFFDDQFLTQSMLFLPLWVGSLMAAGMLAHLDVEPEDDPPPADKTSAEYYMWSSRPQPAFDRQAWLEQLATFFLWGGIGLLLISAIVQTLFVSVRTLALPVMLYFAFGIALLAQGHFGVIHARWTLERLPIRTGIARRWLLWAVVFITGVSLVALLLPTDYASGPIYTLLFWTSYFIGLLYQFFVFLLTLIIFLLSLPLLLISPDTERPPPPTLEPLELAARQPVTGRWPFLEMLLTALFWITVFGIASYALYRFVRDRWHMVAESDEAQRSWWGRILLWLRGLWQRWRAWRRGLQAQLWQRRQAQWETSLPTVTPFRFLSLRRLSPRQLVRYFYLSTEQRATRAGQPRRPGQTPYEYRSTLDQRFPDLEPDLDGLTEAFITARYSAQAVQQADAEQVKPLWQRLKAALRRRRSGRQPTDGGKDD